MKYLFLIFVLYFGASFAQDLKIYAKPGEIYTLPENLVNCHVFIQGSGAERKPFTVKGNKTIISGNSFIKIANNSAHIILKDFTFENNAIDYKESTSLLEIGKSKKSTVSNIVIENIHFVHSENSFKDKDKNTQFHWINVFGNKVTINNCSFEGKKNRLPIVHINSNFKNNIVEHSVFKNVKSRDGEALEAIRIGLGDGSSDATIKNNTFKNYFGDSETISVKAHGVKIIQNHFIDSRSGVSLRLSNNTLVEDNLFENVTNPIRIAGKDHQILNNRFIQKTQRRSISLMSGGIHYPKVDNIVIRGNEFSEEFEIRLIEMPENPNFPTNVHLKDNKVKGKLIKNSTINNLGDFMKETQFSKELRKDDSKVFTIKY